MERGVSCGRKRIARLMRSAGIRGVCHQRKRRGWKPLPAPHDDLVKRHFTAHAPDRVWFCDITQHRARDGWVYCAAVIDSYSRMVVGWSICDHLRSELVVDALEMARWQRKPAPGTIVHSDRGAQYTSWIFGHRLRQAGLLGSMGKVASSIDNALIESFSGHRCNQNYSTGNPGTAESSLPVRCLSGLRGGITLTEGTPASE
jgi:putative transposase